jgi:hypothetical protein
VPVLTGSLQPDGAVVEVLVGWSTAGAQQLRLALRPVPSPLHGRALLDTGAEVTCIDSVLLHRLGPPAGGTVLANVPAIGGFNASTLHDASFTIVHPSGNTRDSLVVPNLTVLELSLASLGYDALLGKLVDFWRQRQQHRVHLPKLPQNRILHFRRCLTDFAGDDSWAAVEKMAPRQHIRYAGKLNATLWDRLSPRADPERGKPAYYRRG